MELLEALERAVSEAEGRTVTAQRLEERAGGDINRAAVLVCDGGERYFVKLNRADRLAMFEAEALGLEEIADSRTLRVPQPLCHGRHGDRAYLVLEYLALEGASAASSSRLAEGLAAMHRVTAAEYGWRRDNTIGSTPQKNARHDDWARFFVTQRLQPQLELARQHGAPASLMALGDKLIEAVPALLRGHRPPPSLLHGDLWAGNAGTLASGEPVIFDPAVYFGDRETDLAMTELFGGFDARFYAAYAQAWPLEPGYRVRKTLYNLYHVLNHFNLFGGGYGAQAQRMMQQLLSETRG